MVISGCSGGGKSTLLAELQARGHRVVEEPGRRIINEERAAGGNALPWTDLAAFLRRAVDMAIADLAAARLHQGWVFFDRGLVDAVSALASLTGEVDVHGICGTHRYHDRVFLAPPWPEIYTTDPERRHGLQAAVAEYDRLAQVYPYLGYEVLLLPKAAPSARADFVFQELGGDACASR